MNTTLLREANDAAARGWLLTPLRGKIPSLKGWTTLPQLSAADINRYVYEGANIGVRTGGGFIVVDVDPGADPELLKRLEAITTPTVRTGRDGRHFYFKGEGRCSVGKISDHVDVRGVGGQVVLPGSIHENGNAYTWIIHPDEAELAPYPPWLEEMARQAKKVRRAKEGTRNDTLNKAAFMAAKAGAPTGELLDAAIEAGLSEEESKATIESGTRAAPDFAPTFVEGSIMVPGEHFFNTGETVTVDQTSFCAAVWRKIPKGFFYTRMGVVVEIVGNAFQVVDATRFRFLVSKFLHLVAHCKQGRDFITEYRSFSPDMGALALAAGPEYTESVRGIVCHPLSGGPHEKWLILEHPKIEPVTDHVSFWAELLIDWPFASEHDRNGYVSFLLTMICKPRIRGPVPIFIITATQPRTGKTKLVTDVAPRVYGRPIANIALGDDEAEIDKRLIARLLSGHNLFSFDNVGRKLESAVLASFATSPVYSARLLGQSKIVEVENDAIIVITGNNVTASEELAKRAIHIRLESKLDHPEMRTDFKYPDLNGHLDANRAKMLGSLMAMGDMQGTPFILGGCEEWGKIVGGGLQASGMPLSQNAYMAWTAEADDETEDVRQLIRTWAEMALGEACELEQVIGWVRGLKIMGRVLDAPSERGQLMRLGHILRGINGRVFGAYRVTSEGTGSRRLWRLVTAQAAS